MVMERPMEEVPDFSWICKSKRGLKGCHQSWPILLLLFWCYEHSEWPIIGVSKNVTNVYKKLHKAFQGNFHDKNERLWTSIQKLPENTGNFGYKLLPQALKSCPNCDKSVNLLTMQTLHKTIREQHCTSFFLHQSWYVYTDFQFEKVSNLIYYLVSLMIKVQRR